MRNRQGYDATTVGHGRNGLRIARLWINPNDGKPPAPANPEGCRKAVGGRAPRTTSEPAKKILSHPGGGPEPTSPPARRRAPFPPQQAVATPPRRGQKGPGRGGSSRQPWLLPPARPAARKDGYGKDRPAVIKTPGGTPTVNILIFDKHWSEVKGQMEKCSGGVKGSGTGANGPAGEASMTHYASIQAADITSFAHALPGSG